MRRTMTTMSHSTVDPLPAMVTHVRSELNKRRCKFEGLQASLSDAQRGVALRQKERRNREDEARRKLEETLVAADKAEKRCRELGDEAIFYQERLAKGASEHERIEAFGLIVKRIEAYVSDRVAEIDAFESTAMSTCKDA